MMVMTTMMVKQVCFAPILNTNVMTDLIRGGEWQDSPRSTYSRSGSTRNSPGITSPPPSLSSPSFGRGIPPPNGGPMRQPAFGQSTTPQTPPKGRPEVLRRATTHGRSPLSRSEGDSTFGTSPDTTGMNGVEQQDRAQKG